MTSLKQWQDTVSQESLFLLHVTCDRDILLKKKKQTQNDGPFYFLSSHCLQISQATCPMPLVPGLPSMVCPLNLKPKQGHSSLPPISSWSGMVLLLDSLLRFLGSTNTLSHIDPEHTHTQKRTRPFRCVLAHSSATPRLCGSFPVQGKLLSMIL